MAALKNLKELLLDTYEDIDGTPAFSGPLPPQWAAMTSLEMLWLTDMKFTGPLPAAWSGMKSLKDLSIGWNQLVGGVPASWKALTNLTTLRLHHNKLTGTVPKWIAQPNLKILRINHNNFVGVLPQDIFNTPIEALTLHNTPALKGCIAKAMQERQGFRMGDPSGEIIELGKGTSHSLTPKQGPLANTTISGWCA
uniref:Leucine-rich repeat-containing N-terminal plant-type domain-containing protein n=1 Tax=Tetradesmus obliquus TaxID=3088 RepID=A0A383WP33_TETOB|eukprot:jgi/Sobl393_1/13810/SZX78929.1